MKRSLKPIDWSKHRGLKRPYSLNKTFGTTVVIPQEFNFNKLNLFPNQNSDNLPEACTAYAQTSIASNEDGTTYDDYDFLYRKTLSLDNSPYGSPCDIISSLKAGTIWGVKRKIDSEEDALGNRRAPYFQVEKLGDWYNGVLSGMQKIQGGISMATEWVNALEYPDNAGVVPNFIADKDWGEGHDWIAYGQKIVNGEPRIICVSHQGEGFGQGGEIYFNRKQINDLLSANGAGAFGQKHASLEDIARVKKTIIDVIYVFMQRLLQIYQATLETLK